MTHFIEERKLYLATFESVENGSTAQVFAMVLLPRTANFENPNQFDVHKIRLSYPRNSPSNAGSNKALSWATTFYVNASKSTMLNHSLPFDPDINLDLYPRLDLEWIPRSKNPAWGRLSLAMGLQRVY
jgi:hypothetical protein